MIEDFRGREVQIAGYFLELCGLEISMTTRMNEFDNESDRIHCRIVRPGNEDVCVVSEKDRTYSNQMKALIAKLARLKY